MVNNCNIKRYIFPILIFVITFINIFFNTVLSPLYDQSLFLHDASVYYIIGKGIKKGMVVYKDLFDHKGLYIYFVYYLASIIGETKNIGVWVVYSLIVFVYSLFIYKTIKLYKNDFIAFITSIVIQIVMTSLQFSFGTLLCEQLTAMTISISIYLMARDLKANNGNIKFSNLFLQGILAAINLSNKPNYCLFFISIVIYVTYKSLIIDKNILLFIKYAIHGVVGIFVGSLPAILYCLANDCFKEMIYCVFTLNFGYTNMFSVDLPKEIDTSFKAFVYVFMQFIKLYVPFIISLVILAFSKISLKEKIYYIFTGLILFITSIMALRPYMQYLIPLIIFICPLVVIIYDGFFGASKLFLWKVAIVFSVAFFAYSFGYGILVRSYPNFSIERNVKFANIIREYREKYDCEIFGAGIGASRYLSFNYVPKAKYFYIPGFQYSVFPEPTDYALDYIENHKPGIVILTKNLVLTPVHGEEINMLMDMYYKPIDIGIDIPEKAYIRTDLLVDY